MPAQQWERRTTPLEIAPAAAPGKNIWGGTTPQAAARFLICAFFFLSGTTKMHSFDKDTGGPYMSLFGPKLDHFLDALSDMTGFKIALSKALYPQILLCAAMLEFLGAVLFASDIRFGAWLLVFITSPLSVILHNFWDFTDRPAVMHNEISHFMKNVAIIGGLLHYLASATGTRHKNRYERTMDAVRAEEAALRRAAVRAVTDAPQPAQEQQELTPPSAGPQEVKKDR